MSFFSKIMKVTPLRKGEKRFERARRAESMSRFEEGMEQFGIAAQAFDEYFAEIEAKNKDARPSHLVKAGMCYTRLGRNEDALRVLDRCISLTTEIPDTYLHAGFAAAQLDQLDQAVQYWSNYPKWFDQKFIHLELQEQLRQLRGPSPDLDAACDAIMQAYHRQDTENRAQAGRQHKNEPFPPNRGY